MNLNVILFKTYIIIVGSYSNSLFINFDVCNKTLIKNLNFNSLNFKKSSIYYTANKQVKAIRQGFPNFFHKAPFEEMKKAMASSDKVSQKTTF